MKNQKKNHQTRKTTRKRKLPELHYNVRRFSDYNNITQKSKPVKMFLFMNVINAVKEGLDKGVEQVGLCELKGYNASILLNKSDWKPSLCKAMEYFSQMEYYETCAKCKELLDQLENIE